MDRLEALKELEKAAHAGNLLAAYNYDLASVLIRLERNYQTQKGTRLSFNELAVVWEHFLSGEVEEALAAALGHGRILALIAQQEADND